jgi:hypothetical protein
MDELIKMAIKALEESNCNEIKLTDGVGNKVRVVKNSPPIWYQSPGTNNPPYSIY